MNEDSLPNLCDYSRMNLSSAMETLCIPPQTELKDTDVQKLFALSRSFANTVFYFDSSGVVGVPNKLLTEKAT